MEGVTNGIWVNLDPLVPDKKTTRKVALRMRAVHSRTKTREEDVTGESER